MPRGNLPPSNGDKPWNVGKLIGQRYLGIEVDDALEIAEQTEI